MAVSFPLVPVIWADTRSPTLMPPTLATLPVTVVALVTMAVTDWPCAPRVIDEALTAVTFPPTSRRSVWPGPVLGIGGGPVPLPVPSLGSWLCGELVGDPLALAGLTDTSCTAVTTRNQAAAAIRAVATSS